MYVVKIRGDAVAADNLVAQYDETGIAGDTFPSTQSQLSGIANVGSAVNKPAASYVLTTGTQSSGTVSSTEALDGTNHEHTDDAGAMDLYYEFLIGGGTPASVTVTGSLGGANDDIEVHGYDWVSSSWKQIGIIEGKASSANEVVSFELFVDMVGSGVNEGKVRVRFTDGAFTLTSATLRIDQVFVSFSQGVEGYENGSIWIDTNASNTGTEVGIDGTARNPVSTIAAAATLSASTNLNRFTVAPGSSITLASTFNNYIFYGEDWTLALGGQDIGGTHFHGATVSGTGTGSSTSHFIDCSIGTVTLASALFTRCGFATTSTLNSAGDYTFVQCYSLVAGSTAPVFDVGTTAATSTRLHFRAWSGGIDLRNLGQAGTDDVSIEGNGNVILNANCIGGTVVIRGNFTLTDNSSTTIVTDDARFTKSETADTVVDEVITGGQHNVPDSLARILRNLRDNGTYEGGAVFINTVDGKPGTTNHENGTNVNPVDSLADATTIALALDLKIFHIVTGSTITLAQTYNDYLFRGHGWTLALGGQDVGGTHIEGPAGVSGIGTGAAEVEFHDCSIGNVTLDEAHFEGCGFSGTVTMAVATDYEVTNGYSTDNNTPIFDFGAAVANIDFNATNWQGSIELQNMGQAGADVANIGGRGHLIINANCVGGTVNISGHMTFTNNGSGMTINDDARIDVGQITSAAGGSVGTGSVVVDHNYGGADNLAFKTAGGAGIDNAVVKAYLKTDYDAGNFADAYVVAWVRTDVNGQWENAMNLDPDTYTFYFFKQGAYEPATKEVTVT